MATDRTVPFTLSVSTVGTESVSALQKEVKALAREGGDAAPEFERLATEIGKLGQQTALVEMTRELGNAIEALKVEEAEAAAKSVQLGTELSALTAKTADMAAAQRVAQEAVNALTQAQKENKDAQKQLAIDAKLAGETTAQNKAQTLALAQAHLDGTIRLRGLNDELALAKVATLEAGRAADSMKESTVQANRSVEAAKGGLQARSAALNEAKTALEASGVATDGLVSAEGQLLAAYNASVTAMHAAVKAQKEEKLAVEQSAAAAEAYGKKMGVINAQIVIAHKDAAAAATLAADAVVQGQNKAAAAAKEAGAQINNALGTVGVKSAAQIRVEIEKVRTAMELLQTGGILTGKELKTAFAAGQAEIKKLERDIREATGTLTMGDKAAKAFSGTLGQMAGGMLVSNGVMMLISKVVELAVAFKDAIFQGDQMRRGLTAVYGSAEMAAKQMEFLRKSSSESGVAFGSLAGEFVKFSASMKSANIPLQDSNNLFKAVTAASATLGLGTEATAGALNALGQAASKGTLSMEELRQQLGDRLPGIMGLTAKGFGITEAQLVKLVSTGQLATRDFIVPFTNALSELKGETDGLVPTWERFKGLLSEVSQGMGDAGGVTVFGAALKILGGTVGYVALTLSFMFEALTGVGRALAATAAWLGGNRDVWTHFGEDVDAASARLGKQRESLQNLLNPQEAVTVALGKHSAALVGYSADALKAGASGEEFSRVNSLMALKAKLAADSTLDLSAKTVQFGAASAAVLDHQEAQTLAYEKLAKASKVQGDALVAITALQGDATLKDEAAVIASTNHSAALDKVTESLNVELAVLEMQRENILKGNAAIGATVEKQKELTDATDKLILKKAAEVEQATQASAAMQLELVARKLAVEVLKDHSDAVTSYAATLDAAKAAVIALEAQEAAGAKVAVQLKAAREALTVAQVLYNDAVADSVTKLETQSKAQSAAIDLATATLQVSQKNFEMLALEARSRDNVTEAVGYEIQAKEAAIAILKLGMTLKDLELVAAEQEIALKRKLIDSTTDEGKQKLAMLDIELQMVKIKQVQNQLGTSVIANLERELKGLRDNANGVYSVVDAYKQLGITTPGEMKKVAQANTAAWATISGDANTTVRTLVTAFEAYGNAALAAARGVSTSQVEATRRLLETEGRARGLELQFDATGRVAVKGGEAAAGAWGDTNAALIGANRTLQDSKKAWDAVRDAANGANQAANNYKNTMSVGGIQGEKRYNNKLNATDVFQVASGAGLSDEYAKKITDMFKAGQFDVAGKANNETGFQYTIEEAKANAFYKALQDAIAKMKVADEAAQAQSKYDKASETPDAAAAAGASSVPASAKGSTPSASAAPSTAPAAASTSGSVVNITIGGVLSKINVAGSQDAATLKSVLEQLAAASGRAA